VICLNDTYSKYDFFQDKCKYSLFDASCQRFWIHTTKILVIRIHKNTVSDEPTVSLQISMQFLPTRLPIIVIQRVEEHFLLWEELWWLLCVCVQTKELHFILRICVTQRTKCFLGILCYLWFFVVSDFKDDFLYL